MAFLVAAFAILQVPQAVDADCSSAALCAAGKLFSYNLDASSSCDEYSDYFTSVSRCFISNDCEENWKTWCSTARSGMAGLQGCAASIFDCDGDGNSDNPSGSSASTCPPANELLSVVCFGGEFVSTDLANMLSTPQALCDTVRTRMEHGRACYYNNQCGADFESRCDLALSAVEAISPQMRDAVDMCGISCASIANEEGTDTDRSNDEDAGICNTQKCGYYCKLFTDAESMEYCSGCPYDHSAAASTYCDGQPCRCHPYAKDFGTDTVCEGNDPLKDTSGSTYTCGLHDGTRGRTNCHTLGGYCDMDKNVCCPDFDSSGLDIGDTTGITCNQEHILSATTCASPYALALTAAVQGGNNDAICMSLKLFFDKSTGCFASTGCLGAWQAQWTQYTSMFSDTFTECPDVIKSVIAAMNDSQDPEDRVDEGNDSDTIPPDAPPTASNARRVCGSCTKCFDTTSEKCYEFSGSSSEGHVTGRCYEGEMDCSDGSVSADGSLFIYISLAVVVTVILAVAAVIVYRRRSNRFDGHNAGPSQVVEGEVPVGIPHVSGTVTHADGIPIDELQSVDYGAEIPTTSGSVVRSQQGMNNVAVL